MSRIFHSQITGQGFVTSDGKKYKAVGRLFTIEDEKHAEELAKVFIEKNLEPKPKAEKSENPEPKGKKAEKSENPSA